MKALATLKCPFCVGNNNNTRNTLYLYSTDTYWCARCKASGVSSDLEPTSLSGITPKLTQPKVIQLKSYNNKGERFSVCKERNFDGTTDSFQIKLAGGDLVGHYHRMPNKVSRIEGVKGFCYRENFLNPSSTYRIVEGTYDCIYPNDVAVLGYPNQFQAKQLKHYNLVLCPDGDVWKEKETIKRWFEPFIYHKKIEQIEVLPVDKDPDEVKESERKLVRWNSFLEWYYRKRAS